MSLRHINVDALGKPKGYTHAIQAPPGASVVFLSGQTARGTDERIVAGGMAKQWAQTLTNVLAVVHDIGGRPASIASMRVYVTDLDAYRGALKEIGLIWRDRMGLHYPAMTLVAVSGLVDEGALVEIEATVVLA